MAFHVNRIYQLLLLFLVLVVMLTGRLFYLQVIAGPGLTAQSLSGRVQEVAMEVSRGEIVDCNGIPFTNTAQQFTLVVFPGQLQDLGTTVRELAEVTGKTVSQVIAGISQDGRPHKLQTGLDALTAQKINALNLPGILVVTEKARYGSSSLAAHVTGYINLADNRGVSGIEAKFDDVLRGSQPEYAAALVDATQQVIPGLGYKRLRPYQTKRPNHVVLTIDSRMQRITESVLDKHSPKGAVIVLQPSTGAVLAMASRPGFDANRLDEYLTSSSAPLLNRAIAAYQPGSVFKLVVAAAALESQVVRPEERFFDPGYIDVNGIRFKGWDYERGPRGFITFSEALAYSSNPVFIEVGQKIGGETLIQYARKLGFGQRTTLDIEGESAGNLPLTEHIYPGELANLSIGQGQFEATPLQVASLVATIVNDGIKVDPYIVARLTDDDGSVIKKYYSSRGMRVLSKQAAAQMRVMMAGVTSYGTGQAAFVEGAGAAGKTGSAETGREDAAGKGINHAWFAGYAPLAQPKYVVVVFVEDGMSGGDVAAPIFREIMTELLALP